LKWVKPSHIAKDIGVLYLMFALFSTFILGLFLYWISLESQASGVQYISDNLFYCLIAIRSIKKKLDPGFITGFVEREGFVCASCASFVCFF